MSPLSFTHTHTHTPTSFILHASRQYYRHIVAHRQVAKAIYQESNLRALKYKLEKIWFRYYDHLKRLFRGTANPYFWQSSIIKMEGILGLGLIHPSSQS